MSSPPPPTRGPHRQRSAAVIALVLGLAAVLVAIARSGGSPDHGSGSSEPTPSSSATAVPPPTPSTSPSLPPPDPSNVVWRGDLETGDLSQYTHLNFSHAPKSDRAVVYTAKSEPDWPAPRQGRYAVRLAADNGDVRPLTPTENPRAQLDSPVLFQEGDEAWLGWSTYFPADFPTELTGNPKWFTLMDIYGEPYNGSGALTFSVDNAGGKQSVTLAHGGSDGDGPAWSTPLVRGVWHDFVIHAKLSRDPKVGFVELWYDGRRQLLLGGTQRLMELTSQPGVSDHNFQINVTNYRAVKVVKGRVTLYQDAVTVGRSYAAVAPRP